MRPYPNHKLAPGHEVIWSRQGPGLASWRCRCDAQHHAVGSPWATSDVQYAALATWHQHITESIPSIRWAAPTPH